MLRYLGGAEPETDHLRLIGPCQGTAVDVGANFGHYSWNLAQIYDRVIAFEPNPQVIRPLVEARLPEVTIKHEALSSAAGELPLQIPVARGVRLSGWASLEKPAVAEHHAIETTMVKVSTLDEHDLSGVGFIKIDVEGHELEVLRGAARTIQRDLPHLLVEIQDRHLPAIRALLASWHYREVSLPELGGPPGSPQNYIFIPEKASV